MTSDNDKAIRDRLERLCRHSSAPVFGGTPDRIAAKSGICPESVGATSVPRSRGVFWLRSHGYDPAEPWGETVPDACCTDLRKLRLRIPFDGSGEDIPLSDCLFVDCETTGLSGGAGIVSFLTAVGRLTGSGFVVDQYFLPDLADEGGILDALAERFAGARALVSYNGAAFDLPLLEGRFRFWRIDPEFRRLPHLDLLWPTRAIFRRRIESCTLGNVEMRLLRFARIEDLPGSEAPEVYFQYLRDGRSPRLHAVFEHNRMDVVSLFAYAVWLNEQTAPQSPSLRDPDDLMALARYWHRRGLSSAVLRALEVAGERILDSPQRARLAELRGRVLKRERRFDDAHDCWSQLAGADPGHLVAAEEQAKHLEHRRKDFAAALAVVDKMLERIGVLETLSEPVAPGVRERLLHRRRRLLGRIARRDRVRPKPSGGRHA